MEAYFKAITRILLLLLLPSFGFGQKDKTNYVEITGVVEDFDGNPMSGATVKLLENNNQVKSITTTSNGEFQFFVDYNSYFIVEISKSGMITKRIAYDTKMPEGTEGRWGVGTPVYLFEGCEGVETSIMNDPVVVIRFNEKKRELEGDDGYAQQMQAKIAGLMGRIEDCKQQAYKETIKEADTDYRLKNYEEARKAYEEALDLKPGDPYATKKLEEINQILAKEDQNEKLYEVNIKEGDKYFDAGNLPLAKSFYQRSLTFKPNEEYAINKLAEINRLLTQEETDKNQEMQQTEQKAKEEAYNKLIAQADQLFNSKDYEGAKNYYNQAQTLNPNAPYPKNRINEIDNIYAARKQEEAQNQANEYAYKKAIIEADQYFQVKDYVNAKVAYQKALTYKPDATYPRTKIAEIDQLLSAQQRQIAQEQAKEESYRNAIKQGDQYLLAQNYPAAKAAYQQALAFKPNDSYPQTKITEIDRLVSQQQQQMAQDQAKEQAYKNAIAEADQYFQAKNYPAAKAAYQKALTFKPNESYPRTKMAEVDRIVSEQQRKIAQDQAKEESYKNAIKEGDQYLQGQNYPSAKEAFQKALTFKPNELYPQTKISEIDRIISEKQQQMAQEQAKEQAYKNAIAEADQYFQAKNYPVARATYQKALTFKPNESYPRTRITEIDRIIAEQQSKLAQEQAKEQAYKNALAEGAQYFQDQNYPASKASYQKALSLKPGDNYSQTKITEIDKLVAEQQRLAAQAKDKEDQYNKAVANGDKYFQSGDYPAAKSSFEQALTIKPGSIYPTNKIREIENLLTQQQIIKDYQNIIARADNCYKQNNLDAAKTEYEKASRLKPEESYPKSRIQEINDILKNKQQEELVEKQKKQEFERLITLADTYFNKNDYKNAQDFYKNALKIFPNAPHPNQRLKEIENLLKQQKYAQPTVKKGPELVDLKFATKDEEERYLAELKKKYPEGVTLEIYKTPKKTVRRYIVIRSGAANEFRQAQFSWGSEYTLNGRDITDQYFDQQTEVREGEYFKSFEIVP